MNREMLKLIIGTSSGILIGGFVGYVVTRRVLKTKYEDILQTEIASLKAYYNPLLKDKVEADEMDAVHESTLEEYEYVFAPHDISDEESTRMSEELQEELEETKRQKSKNEGLVQVLGYSTDPDDEINTLEVRPLREARKMTVEEETPIDPNDELLQEMILARRNDEPYIITVDEFMEDVDFIDDKISLTYFDGDDNLIDQREKIVPDSIAILGADALTKFGLFSKDKNIVYVRNEKLRADFEVALDERSFTEAIAGFRDPKVLRKMREDD